MASIAKVKPRKIIILRSPKPQKVSEVKTVDEVEEELKDVTQNLEMGTEIDDITKDVIRSNGRFRIDNRRLHLTYSYQFNIALYLEEIIQRIFDKDNKLSVYSIVHEKGTRNVPHPHTHAAFEFVKPIIITDPRFFDYKCPEVPKDFKSEHVHPNIKAVTTCKHWHTICGTYHLKDGVPVTNYVPLEKPSVPTMSDVNNCKDKKEIALMLGKKDPRLLSKVSQYEDARIALQSSDDKPVEVTVLELRPWQEYMKFYLTKKRDNRTVTWIVDYRGSSGKTEFSKYMDVHHNSLTITTLKISDAAYLLKEYVAKHGTPGIVFINITRTSKDFTGVFTIIESLKDGRFTCGKYATTNVRLEFSPNVVVLSNGNPKIDKLSDDRWCVHYIDSHHIVHSFRGSEAQALYEEDIRLEMMKVEEAKQQLEVYIPQTPNSESWPITFFEQGQVCIRILRDLIHDNKIGTLSITTRPLTKRELIDEERTFYSYEQLLNSQAYNEGNKSESKKHSVIIGEHVRKLTHAELRDGISTDVSLTIRDMTASEIEDNKAIKVRNLLRDREDARERARKIREASGEMSDFRESLRLKVSKQLSTLPSKSTHP